MRGYTCKCIYRMGKPTCLPKLHDSIYTNMAEIRCYKKGRFSCSCYSTKHFFLRLNAKLSDKQMTERTEQTSWAVLTITRIMLSFLSFVVVRRILANVKKFRVHV